MRVAVVGAGGIGSLHASLLSAMDGVDKVLVVDTDADRASTVAARTGARAKGFTEAIDAADAVVVATPPEFHAQAVLPALAAGRSVLCEKPLSDSLEESVRMAARGGHLEVGFQRRHDAAMVAARDAASGTRIHLVHMTAFDPVTPPRTPESWPTGEAAPVFLHSSVHDFDFVRWLTGQEVIEVTADGSRRDESRPDDPRGIESAVVLMRLSGGALATLNATWLHPGGYDIRAEIVTDREAFDMGLSGRTPARHLEWAVEDGRAAWAGYLDRFEAAYRAELVAFLAAARGESAPATTGRDGVEALRIAVAATRSFVERRTVPLAEVGAAVG
ncbi:MAG TPA: Gfo/Idh/MocA family oxidoreductase [Candidatus Limnocylindria bacterium]|nr:Gfo/Idh/MocA family oxidoreductase [Candidatus Limnocylindria bacterium]